MLTCDAAELLADLILGRLRSASLGGGKGPCQKSNKSIRSMGASSPADSNGLPDSAFGVHRQYPSGLP